MQPAGAPIDHVALHARLDPTHLALADLAHGQRWSYAELDGAVAQAARVLREGHACAPGDRVASLARNCAELVILSLACARIGAIYVPLNWRLSPAEIAALIEDAAPRLVVGDGELDRAGVAGGVALEALAAEITSATPLPPEPIDPKRPSLILYTSGTSGGSRGAVLSEENLTYGAISFGLLSRVTHESVFLVDAPMFHVIGLVTSIRSPLVRGGTVLVSDGFEPSRTMARLSDPQLAVSHYFCVPQMASMLREAPDFDPANLRGLTGIFTGGAPHSAAAIREWLDDGICVAHGYGMSETGTVFGMPVNRDVIAAKAGSVGLPTPSVECRIVDSSDRDCAPEAPGELLLRGANVTSRYWNRPRETELAFTADGWFRTGDIAVRDSDGFYFIVDRKKDMYVSGGENVFPVEIELALADFPGLAEAVVIGVPDARWGEVGLCVFAARPGAKVDEAALRVHLEARLARFKLPRYFVEVEALPKTGTGKVRKSVVRDRYARPDDLVSPRNGG